MEEAESKDLTEVVKIVHSGKVNQVKIRLDMLKMLDIFGLSSWHQYDIEEAKK